MQQQLQLLLHVWKKKAPTEKPTTKELLLETIIIHQTHDIIHDMMMALGAGICLHSMQWI